MHPSRAKSCHVVRGLLWRCLDNLCRSFVTALCSHCREHDLFAAADLVPDRALQASCEVQTEFATGRPDMCSRPTRTYIHDRINGIGNPGERKHAVMLWCGKACPLRGVARLASQQQLAQACLPSHPQEHNVQMKISKNSQSSCSEVPKSLLPALVPSNIEPDLTAHFRAAPFCWREHKPKTMLFET